MQLAGIILKISEDSASVPFVFLFSFFFFCADDCSSVFYSNSDPENFFVVSALRSLL